MNRKLITCIKGHRYYKSSDCRVCPACAAKKKPASGFPSKLAAPARRALSNNNIITLQQLSAHTETEISQWHVIGPSAIISLRMALAAKGLSFKQPKNYL